MAVADAMTANIASTVHSTSGRTLAQMTPMDTYQTRYTMFRQLQDRFAGSLWMRLSACLLFTLNLTLLRVIESTALLVLIQLAGLALMLAAARREGRQWRAIAGELHDQWRDADASIR